MPVVQGFGCWSVLQVVAVAAGEGGMTNNSRFIELLWLWGDVTIKKKTSPENVIAVG